MRLEGVTYNKKEWSITKFDPRETRIVNKKMPQEQYHLFGNIVGIEQIDSNLFLVCKYFESEKKTFSFSRIRLLNGKIFSEYEHDFKTLDFLSKDTIIFDRNYVRSTVVYSIRENCEYEKIKNIISPDFEDFKFNIQRKIRPIMFIKKGKEYPKYLEVTYRYGYYKPESLKLLLNPISLRIVSAVYSSVSNSLFYVSASDYSLEDLIVDELKANLRMEDFLDELYDSDVVC